MGFSNRLVLGVIGAAVVITLITIPAVYYSRSGASKRPFTLQDYFNDTIRKKSYNLYWMSDKEYVHKETDGNVYLHNAETKDKDLYLSNATFKKVDATDYWLSGDHNYIAFESNYTKNFRHSYSASYSIYDMTKSTFVTPASLPRMVQYFSFAPEGNQYAYVSNFNIFLNSNVTAESVQLTTNGKKNEILNGIPDWIYEEEVFASNGAIWWSSTGRFLAYAQFNDTEVQKVEFSWYGSEQYPETVAIPYPKAGSNLTKVKLFVVDTANPTLHSQLALPASMAGSDHILCSVTWATDERVAVQWLTRKQNHVVVAIYDFDGSSWREKEKFEQTSKTGWIGHYMPLPIFFAEDKLSFYKVMSDTQGYKHIHYIKNGKATPITSGKWEVIYISKLTKDAIYFVSNQHERNPVKRNLYKIMLGSSPSTPMCLTCGLHEDRCQYNSAYLSVDASFYRMDCYGPGLPLYTLMDNRGSGAGTELSILEDNKDLENLLSEFQMPTMKYGTVKIAGFDMWYQMMLPPDFQKSKKYPLLIDVYAGPCSQSVSYQNKLNWGTYLSSSLGIIVASVDGRGSGYQGDEIMHAIYKHLGTFEVEDQMSAVRKFIDMGFIDKDRIAIWGWSYGGYVTSMALGAGTGLFKCGIAVAPVAKWDYYDAVYTERYMGKPSENSDSYKNSTVTSRAKNFKKVAYLLIHGTADDNVHFQQAAQISKALVEELVDFEAMWYTDKDHSLRGQAYHHTYTLMSHFLQKCLLNPE
ncbi:dipeptidyl peptidase 4 [Xiphophorus maculatus]|uniref:Fibroblast activation protein, alpha n=1 Tax=Xiphophorus maculatus TaxID=8083 RepID=A0A3B5QJJ8_XIPMA|nr:dipeptidyl peptidase 4 [Xiphophorus maculatus]XP_023192655.1 dipeptidyl peptidase 4 [Xiphophorus maculatus]